MTDAPTIDSADSAWGVLLVQLKVRPKNQGDITVVDAGADVQLSAA